MDGNYTEQPPGAQFGLVFHGLLTNGGNISLNQDLPTRTRTDALLDSRFNEPFTRDANDLLYQWNASRDYNPSGDLEKIQAAVLAINSADDERYPPELGMLEKEIKRVKNGLLLLIPASSKTTGHGTAGKAAQFWKDELARLLQMVPSKFR